MLVAMTHAWRLMLGVLLTVAAIAPARAQQTYHDSVHGFSLGVPPGWTRATQAALATFPLSPPSGGTAVSLAGYVRGASAAALKAPFLIIESRTQPFSLDGVSWEELSGRLGLVPFEDLKRNGQFDGYGRYRGDGLSPPTLVQADEMILVQGTLNGADGTPLYLYSMSFPGRNEIIRVSVFLPAMNNESMFREAETIRDSFGFDSGREFNPPEERRTATGSRYGRRGPFGFGVGGVVCLIVYALRRWAAS